MKKLIATRLASTQVSLAAYGQGMINFANFVGSPAYINSNIFRGETEVTPVGEPLFLPDGRGGAAQAILRGLE